MATPQYPAILTEADWKKNKTKIKLSGDAIGKQLLIVNAAHRGVVWGMFDAGKTLTGIMGGQKLKAQDAQEALDRAKAEYDRNVKLLLSRLKVLEDEIKKEQSKAKSDHLTKMIAAATQYGAQAQTVQAEFAVYEKARDDAKLAAGDDDEDEEPEVPDNSPPVLVKDVIGRQFFANLDTITFYRDDDVRRWTEEPNLVLSPKDKKPIPELREAQEKGTKFLLAFVTALNELRLLGDASLPPSHGIKRTRMAWKKLRANFDKPGFRSGAYKFWERKQLDAVGQGAVDAWIRQNSPEVQLHNKVGDILSENHKTFNNLEKLMMRAQVKK